MTKVFCYRNLNRKGVVWSVRSQKTGLVVDRKTFLLLKDVQFKVSDAGRKRVLRQLKKNVHAGVQGYRTTIHPKGEWIRVEYNPYKYASFVYSHSKEPVAVANYVKLTDKGCFILKEIL